MKRTILTGFLMASAFITYSQDFTIHSARVGFKKASGGYEWVSKGEVDFKVTIKDKFFYVHNPDKSESSLSVGKELFREDKDNYFQDGFDAVDHTGKKCVLKIRYEKENGKASSGICFYIIYPDSAVIMDTSATDLEVFTETK